MQSQWNAGYKIKQPTYYNLSKIKDLKYDNIIFVFIYLNYSIKNLLDDLGVLAFEGVFGLLTDRFRFFMGVLAVVLTLSELLTDWLHSAFLSKRMLGPLVNGPSILNTLLSSFSKLKWDMLRHPHCLFWRDFFCFVVYVFQCTKQRSLISLCWHICPTKDNIKTIFII